MSRCYPFPPPGYEPKIATGDVDVLAEEKHKAKKHKKDKDREKKDGKVKDKDRNKEKSKEKKDRREKRKHKKDRKDKSKDHEKGNGTSNDKKPAVHLNSVNGARTTSDVLQIENHNSGNLNHVEELARRIRVEGQATGSQIVHKNTAKDEEKVSNSNNLLVSAKRTLEKEKNTLGSPILPKVGLVDQAKVPMHMKTHNRNGCILPEQNQSRNIRQVDDRMIDGTMDSSHSPGLDKRMGGQMLPKTRLVDQAKVTMHTRRTDDGNVCFVRQPNGKEKGTQVDGRTINGTGDSSDLQVLVKRKMVKETNGLGGQVVQKIGLMDQRKGGMHVRTGDGNGCFVPKPNGMEKGIRTDGRMVNDAMDSSHLQVLAKRNLEEEKFGLGGKIVQKDRLVDQEKVHMHMGTDDGNGCYRLEPIEKEKGSQVDARTVNGGRNFEEAMDTNDVAANWRMAKPPEAKTVRIDSEGTDKIKYNGQNNYKMDKQKRKDWDKNGELNDKVRDKENKKEEKAKEKCEFSNGQSKVTKGGSERNGADGVNIEESGQSKASTGKILAGEGDLGKRKELEINGLLHENGSRPHKMHKPVASSPTKLQNGGKYEECQMEKLKTNADVVGLKNGMIEAPPRKRSSKSPLPTAMEASMRPPHPDSVLLDQILSLSEIDRTPDFDDQEWLFCNSGHREKLKISESDSSENQMVWNHGRRIESADIFALPYVIPF